MPDPQYRERFASMKFPTAGIDLSSGFLSQRPLTTVMATNVRAYDAMALRSAGGSRAGLAPYIPTQAVNDSVIQHLNAIVSISQAATPNNAFSTIAVDINYSESDHPPPRNAPLVTNDFDWFVNTSPTFTCVSGVVVGAPDGGGTGQGTAQAKLSTDGTTITLLGTFESAGFPGPYFYSGSPQVITGTELATNFFTHGNPGISLSWTVVNFGLGFIGNLELRVYWTG
jgi:hypothetical protein